MGCDKGGVEMTRKVNTRTSLFLFCLLAEQLSPKSLLPPEFLPSLYFQQEGDEGGVGSGRQGKKHREEEKGGQPHMCLRVCLLTQARPQKVHAHARKHTHTQRQTHLHCSSDSSTNSRPFSSLV